LFRNRSAKEEGLKTEFIKTLEAEVDVLIQVDTSTWLEWNRGLALVF